MDFNTLTSLTALDIVVLAAATWRLSYLLTKEKAPFGVMSRLRERTTLGGLLSCLYCASIWSAALMLLLWQVDIGRFIALIFAVSGGALMLASYSGAGHTQ